MKICTKCHQPCDVVEKHWQEKDEFWGAPCWRDCYEDVSDCCHEEIEETEEVTA
jgi:hypothetical protein